MNIVIVSGNVTQKYVNNGNVRVSIADNYKGNSTYIPITAYGAHAEFLQKYVEPGDHISIEGRVGVYKTAENIEKMSVIAQRINFEGYRNPNKPKPTAIQNAEQISGNEGNFDLGEELEKLL